jgi:ferritin
MKPFELNHPIVSLLLPRLKDEFDASFFYRAASNWCANKGYTNAAIFFSKESEDELLHAKGIEDFLIQWNVLPTLPAIQKPEISFNNLPDIINQAYSIEYDLYRNYNDTSSKVLPLDLSVFDFLSKYRDIQTKSVAEYSDMLNQLALIDSSDKFQLFYWEKENFK